MATGRKRTSLLYWYPRVADAGVPIPRTRIVEVDHDTLARFVLGEGPLSDETLSAMQTAAAEVGYPLFVRSVQASNKHGFASSSFVPGPDVLMQHIYGVLEFNEMADFLGLPYEAIVLREFLTLESRFKAFDGLPIARERRYFVSDGTVLCHHPYWPAGAIEGGDWGKPSPPANWRALLAEISEEPAAEVELLTEYAQRLGERLPGFWSLDFARSTDGTWYFIDAAAGEMSWHPAHDGSGGQEPVPAGVTPDPGEAE